MSSASLVRKWDCVMLIVANRSGSDVAPRGIQTTRRHSMQRSLIPRWSKSFRKGPADQARVHRRHSCRTWCTSPFVLLDIGVVFFLVAPPTHFLFFPSPTSRRGCRSHQLERRSKLDRLVQCPVQGAPHGVNAVRAFDCFPCDLRRQQAHRHVNAADNKHTLLSLHLSGYFSGQFSVARVDLARFQRTSEGAHHSTRGCRNDIVNG